MSYIVFALKWRPQNFSEVVGQDNVVAKLKGALEKKRLAHAYLFAGPRGVGKTSLARIFAKALNCKEGITVEPCGKCSNCQEITQGHSLDVIEIDGASNRGIEEIRVLRENVKFAPVNSRFKIYIIDEVHMLTVDAFNALLKTLEEPPEFVKFIFATTQPHKVIPTVLSRCQRFDFRHISVMEIVAKLQEIAQKENISVDKEVLFAIAKASDGSLRDAESVFDQLVSFSKEKLSLKDVISMLGLVEEEILFEITEKIIKKDSRGCLELLNNIIEEGKDVDVFLDELIEHFRNLMIAKVSSLDTKLIDLPQETCERLFKQAEEFSLAQIFNIFNTLVNTKEMSKRLESLRIPLEVALVKLTHERLDLRPSEPISKPLAPKTKNNPIKKEEVSPSIKREEAALVSEATVTSENISLDKIIASWQNLIDHLAKVKMSLATFLNEGSPIKIENNILTISLPKDCSLNKEALEKKENKAIVEKALSELFPAKFRVNFILSEENSPKEDYLENPFVKSALQAFKARVIKEE